MELAAPSNPLAKLQTLARDIYIVFEGRNPDTDKPIIKVFLNPLVNWIWIGVVITFFGTLIALVPPLLPKSRTENAPPPSVLTAEAAHV